MANKADKQLEQRARLKQNTNPENAPASYDETIGTQTKTGGKHIGKEKYRVEEFRDEEILEQDQIQGWENPRG